VSVTFTENKIRLHFFEAILYRKKTLVCRLFNSTWLMKSFSQNMFRTSDTLILVSPAKDQRYPGAREGRVKDPPKIWSWGQKLHMTLININYFCVVSNNNCIYHLHLGALKISTISRGWGEIKRKTWFFDLDPLLKNGSHVPVTTEQTPPLNPTLHWNEQHTMHY